MSYTLLKSGRLLDAQYDYEPLDILVEGDRIRQIAPQIPAAEGMQIFDLSGHTVAPGIINAHTHIFYGDVFREDRFMQMARSGLHAVHDLCFLDGSELESALAKKSQLSSPRFPAMCVAGKYVAVQDGYGAMEPANQIPVGYIASSPENAGFLAEKILAAGCDGLKIGMDWGFDPDKEAPNLPAEYIRAIAQTAQANHTWLAAHVTDVRYLETLLDNGITEMAHITGQPIPERLLEKIVERQINVTPTLVIWKRKIDRLGECAREWFETATENVRQLHRAGVKIAVGTDFFMHREAYDLPIEEMRLLYQAGLSVRECLVAATLRGAEFMGWSHRMGALKEGLLANIIAFPGPLDETFDALCGIDFSMNQGQLLT